ncbi:MAG: hypothetical protein DWQ28_01910, partial [Proteobacteria bacterium]
LLLATATVGYAEENTATGTPGEALASSDNQSSESSSSNGDKSAMDLDQIDSSGNTDETTDGVTATSPLEGDATENASAANAESELNESITAADDYRATERISEDRSVSFPVDI